jgi:hypothetical protein
MHNGDYLKGIAISKLGIDNFFSIMSKRSLQGTGAGMLNSNSVSTCTLYSRGRYTAKGGESNSKAGRVLLECAVLGDWTKNS